MADNFTAADAIQSGGTPAVQTKIPTTTLYVHATSLNIRDKASSSAKSLGKLLRGDKIEVVNITSDGWALLPGGKFVMAKAGKTDYLAKSKPAPLKKTVKPTPAPAPQADDQPPPPPQDTESSALGIIVPVSVLALFLLLWMRRK